jgi:fumarate hydratase class II
MRRRCFTTVTGSPREAFKTGQTIREVAREQTDLSEDEELDEALDAKKMTGT